jgi:hypothetical protein
VKRGEALACAAGMIVRRSPDLDTLCTLLEYSGSGKRLAAAIRARAAEPKPAEVGGQPRPDPAMWVLGEMKVVR